MKVANTKPKKQHRQLYEGEKVSGQSQEEAWSPGRNREKKPACARSSPERKQKPKRETEGGRSSSKREGAYHARAWKKWSAAKGGGLEGNEKRSRTRTIKGNG